MTLTQVARSTPEGLWIIFKTDYGIFTVWQYPQWGEYGLDLEGNTIGYFTSFDKAKRCADGLRN